MEFTDPRLALSAILRPATPRILKRIVEEAARASGARPADIAAYEAVLNAMTPPVLDAIASDDATRTSTLGALVLHESEGRVPLPSIPPVARVGLLEIGIRLGRNEVASATTGLPGGAEVLREFEVLADQLRVATQLGLGAHRTETR